MSCGKFLKTASVVPKTSCWSPKQPGLSQVFPHILSLCLPAPQVCGLSLDPWDRLTVIPPHAKGTWHRKGTLIPVSAIVLLGMLYKKKERQDFIFTIYHWWQALAIFTVYLWSGLPMKVSRRYAPGHSETFQAFWGLTPTPIPKSRVPQAKLSIMLLTLVVAVGTYLWMERKVAWNVEVRLPRIPRPRHKTRGYRYLEDNSDETGSDGDGDKENDDRHPTEGTREDELPKEDRDHLG